MDFEINWPQAGVAIVLWLIFAAIFITPSVGYIRVFGRVQTYLMVIILLPIAYFVVNFIANR